jgi:peptidoglycan hydrolase-like amidase
MASLVLPREIRVLHVSGVVLPMVLEEYLRGVVPAELSGAPLEAAKAQAVAARSYAVTQWKHHQDGADVCTRTHCQVWGPRYEKTADEAIQATAGEVLIYGGRIVPGFYHAWCGGQTLSAREVWGVEVAYCQPVACPCGMPQRGDHGVGMCQVGAVKMARAGASYLDILKHYYRGVRVERVGEGSDKR